VLPCCVALCCVELSLCQRVVRVGNVELGYVCGLSTVELCCIVLCCVVL